MTKQLPHVIICLLLMGWMLPSCALFRPASSSATSSPGSPQFIPGIALDRQGQSSVHQSGNFRSTGESAPPSPSTPDEEDHSVREKYARILGVDDGDISDLVLYHFIEDWWGIPYKLGGTTRNGIDCSAFVQLVYSTVFNDSTLPRTATQQFAISSRVSHTGDLQEGDLVFFKSLAVPGRSHRKRSLRIVHVGIYLQNDKFVHASTSSGVTISDLKDSYWQKRYAGAGRLN